MTETPLPRRTAGNRLWIGVAALVVVLVAGVSAWTTSCPCNQTPGFMLLGDVQTAPVTDWQFVNDIPLCQIQMSAFALPHAVNLNCMSTPDGELYLSCSVCDRKFWARHVEDGEQGRLRVNGRVYPIVFSRVTDEAELDRAWAARVRKLQVHGEPPYNPAPPPDAKRPPSWATFHLRSATS